MNLEEALKDCFRDQPYRGTPRKHFHNKEAAQAFADSISEEDKLEGYGLIHSYAGFNGEQIWYEVTYKFKP